MFGDMGHGCFHLLGCVCMFLFAPRDIRKYRFLYLLMAIFAIFAGSLYNEFFSIPFDLFGSCYSNVKDSTPVPPAPIDPNTTYTNKWYGCREHDCTYPWGIDPKWYVASNNLLWINGFKMKFAVIAGVFQMVLGIFLKCFNSLYF
jgi:V-type H+-transporting ATPase subunit a